MAGEWSLILTENSHSNFLLREHFQIYWHEFISEAVSFFSFVFGVSHRITTFMIENEEKEIRVGLVKGRESLNWGRAWVGGSPEELSAGRIWWWLRRPLRLHTELLTEASVGGSGSQRDCGRKETPSPLLLHFPPPQGLTRGPRGGPLFPSWECLVCHS